MFRANSTKLEAALPDLRAHSRILLLSQEGRKRLVHGLLRGIVNSGISVLLRISYLAKVWPWTGRTRKLLR